MFLCSPVYLAETYLQKLLVVLTGWEVEGVGLFKKCILGQGQTELYLTHKKQACMLHRHERVIQVNVSFIPKQKKAFGGCSHSPGPRPPVYLFAVAPFVVKIAVPLP